MLVFVSGPYAGDRKANIAAAREVAVQLWKLGHAVICPHMNSAFMDDDGIPDEAFYQGDLNILARCDALVMLPNWETSKGARIEGGYARLLDIPICLYPDLPPLHPTEVKAPRQVRAFRETIGRMYRMHLQKNADYSPANIGGPGMIGLATRLWDKVARLMNLIGFEFDAEFRGFEPKAPRNESLADTLLDAAVYAVNGLIVQRGDWGK